MTQDMDVKKQTAIKELLAQGKKKGKLTLKEMSDALESIDMESDELDRLYEELEKAGIETTTLHVGHKAIWLLRQKAKRNFPRMPSKRSQRKSWRIRSLWQKALRLMTRYVCI